MIDLTVLERLVLLNVIPKEGDFTTLKLVRKFREELSFNEAENKVLDFKQEGDQVKWDEKASVVKEFDLAEDSQVRKLIVDALKKLSDDKKLRDEHFTLYEKFVDGE